MPRRHRTDRLSTAVNNATNPSEFTDRYEGLLRHCGMQGEKTQAGHGNENGDVEQRHRRFKRAVEQAQKQIGLVVVGSGILIVVVPEF